MRSCRSPQGQQVIEYLLMSAAVVVVLITGILLKGGAFVQATNTVMQTPAKLMEKNKNTIHFVDSAGNIVTF